MPLTLSPFLNACTTLVVLHLEMDDAYPFVPDMFGTMRFPSLRIFRINAGPLTPQLLTCFLPGMPILESLCVMGASKDIGQCATPICTHASVTTLRFLGLALSAKQAHAFRALIKRLTALDRIYTYEGDDPALTEAFHTAKRTVRWSFSS